MTDRLTAVVSGDVQGVGFRDWVRQRAESLDLAGSARNLPDGRVEVIAEGSRDALDSLLSDLRGGAGPGTVGEVSESWEEADGESGFRLG